MSPRISGLVVSFVTGASITESEVDRTSPGANAREYLSLFPEGNVSLFQSTEILKTRNRHRYVVSAILYCHLFVLK
jgi:hypothetical protein